MDGKTLRVLLGIALVVLICSGAQCPNMVQPHGPPPPRVLSPTPGLDEVVQAVNHHASQVHNVSTNNATLSGPGFPSLRAQLAYEKPRQFRIRAETGLTGPEIDLGSNNDLFWVWIRRNEPPAVFFCRHEDYAVHRHRMAMPLDPEMLVEVLGVTELDPALPHQGPFPRPDGRLEIRTIRETPQGPATKITLVDASSALVVGHALFGPDGTLVASATAGDHRRDPLSGLYWPRTIDLSCPPAQFALRVEMDNVRINRMEADRGALFAVPQFESYPLVNLCDPNATMALPPAASGRGTPLAAVGAPPARGPAPHDSGLAPPRAPAASVQLSRSPQNRLRY